MGNHSDSGELLEEALANALTEGNNVIRDVLFDGYGNAILLNKPIETATENPKRLRDGSGRDVDMIQVKMRPTSEWALTTKQVEALLAKQRKTNPE